MGIVQDSGSHSGRCRVPLAKTRDRLTGYAKRWDPCDRIKLVPAHISNISQTVVTASNKQLITAGGSVVLQRLVLAGGLWSNRVNGTLSDSLKMQQWLDSMEAQGYSACVLRT